MFFIDTHTHLYLPQFEEDRAEVIDNAQQKGVEYLLLPNVDSETIDSMLDMEVKWPGKAFAMMGLHPCSVKANYKEELAIVRAWLEKRKFIAVGEIGLDYYWDKTFVKEQEEAFLKQAEWAMEFDVPIVIHSRDSIDELIQLLKKINDSSLKGIFHCFTGDLRQAEDIMALDFKMGLGGVLTFKNSGLDKVAKDIPMEYIMLETDAPYLTPTPYRGKRNESAYIPLIAEKLAEVKGISIEEVAQQTSANTLKLFGMGL